MALVVYKKKKIFLGRYIEVCRKLECLKFVLKNILDNKRGEKEIDEQKGQKNNPLIVV